MSMLAGRQFYYIVTHSLREISNAQVYETPTSYTIDFDNPAVREVVHAPLLIPAFREKRWFRGSISLDRQYNRASVNVPILIRDWDKANALVYRQFKPYCPNGHRAVHETPPPYTDEVGFLYLTDCSPSPEFFKKLAAWYPVSPE